tara:strand:- start:431 stop:733 length:303 start_codon:yes stop_codon:yes gene_type:complete
MDSDLKIFRKRQPDYSVEKRIIASIVGNRFFTVHFYTNKGEFRKLNGRLGVTKYTKLYDDTVEIPNKYLVVYDVKAKGYRNVNIETIQCINVDNVYHMNV